MFLRKESTFFNEDVLWKEILIFFMNSNSSNGLIRALKNTVPLDFDEALAEEYIECFMSNEGQALIMDELEHHYSELSKEEQSNRLNFMKLIGNPNVDWNDSEDQEESDEN